MYWSLFLANFRLYFKVYIKSVTKVPGKALVYYLDISLIYVVA